MKIILNVEDMYINVYNGKYETGGTSSLTADDFYISKDTRKLADSIFFEDEDGVTVVLK